ncbi:DUF3489 domain-containing protein [Ferriphaselus sp. R-1]|uniref:DUF3489 domain-containing protein n=1 Tax=Ferriphaselus sp. R-1 TaxID=1485544 RepID=UPI0006925441|nr:DUF3489 domain-containing protein [Ferriphaselus sp. R-1]
MTKAISATKVDTSNPTNSLQPNKGKTAHASTTAPTSDAAVPGKVKRTSHRKRAEQLISSQLSKQDRLITLMSHTKGTTIDELMTATGWQAHSIRGVISGVLRKRLGLNVVLEAHEGGASRYRILKSAQI